MKESCDGKVFYLLAKCLYYNGDVQICIELLNSALKQRPKDEEILSFACSVQVEIKNLFEAQRLLEKLISLNPLEVSYYLSWAKLLLSEDQHQKRILLLEEAHHLKPLDKAIFAELLGLYRDSLKYKFLRFENKSTLITKGNNLFARFLNHEMKTKGITTSISFLFESFQFEKLLSFTKSIPKRKLGKNHWHECKMLEARALGILNKTPEAVRLYKEIMKLEAGSIANIYLLLEESKGVTALNPPRKDSIASILDDHRGRLSHAIKNNLDSKNFVGAKKGIHQLKELQELETLFSYNN